MPTRITLICHGSTRATRTAAFPLDEPLEKQPAPASGTVTSLRKIDRCWTSPALCARQTAAALELAPAVDPDLRDCDYESWAGRRLRDVGAEEPNAIAMWLSDVSAVPHGGESIANVLRRIAAWLDRRIGENGHGVAVTHAAVIRCAHSSCHWSAGAFVLAYRHWSVEHDGVASRRVALALAAGEQTIRIWNNYKKTGSTLPIRYLLTRGADQLVLLLSHMLPTNQLSNQGVVCSLVDTSQRFAFQCARSGAPITLIGVKRESGAIAVRSAATHPELPPQLSAVSPSPTCHWVLRMQDLGRRRGAEIREPGNLPEQVILPACGARARGGVPLR
jgi:broad specificity phosphatase PhoE